MHKISVAIVIEVLLPLAFFGLVGWGFWLWYKLKLARAEKVTRLQEELAELRAYKQDTEKRLQALETIATLGEGKVRVTEYEGVAEDADTARRRKD